jgi:hypothetical protein
MLYVVRNRLVVSEREGTIHVTVTLASTRLSLNLFILSRAPAGNAYIFRHPCAAFHQHVTCTTIADLYLQRHNTPYSLIDATRSFQLSRLHRVTRTAFSGHAPPVSMSQHTGRMQAVGPFECDAASKTPLQSARKIGHHDIGGIGILRRT